MPELAEKNIESNEVSLYSPGSEGIGNILIQTDVIARIAGMATSEVEGVSLGQKSWVEDILRGKEAVKGIQVERQDNGRYSITCAVRMAYGSPMRATAEKLQRHVKEAVERMAGLELESVDVKILDIYIETDKDRDQAED